MNLEKECKLDCNNNYIRGGCAIHDISECCNAGKIIGKRGYSHCKKCKNLFTSKKWEWQSSDPLPLTEQEMISALKSKGYTITKTF